MKALFLQPFGLGDCIFSIGIARHFIAQGYEIIWPVLPHFKEGLQRAYPFIKWESVNKFTKYMDIKEKCEVDNMLIVPIRWSMEYMKCEYKHVMRAKYDMYDLDWTKWKEGSMFERDVEKEEECMRSYNSVSQPAHELGKGYQLNFTHFGSNFQYMVTILANPKLAQRGVVNNPAFSLFDYSLLMQCATEIHAVSSSNIYLFELLDIQCPIHIYKREPIEKNHDNYSYILTKSNYILH